MVLCVQVRPPPDMPETEGGVAEPRSAGLTKATSTSSELSVVSVAEMEDELPPTSLVLVPSNAAV